MTIAPMMDAAAAPVTAERLFQQYFWPLYPDDVRQNLALARVTDANPARNGSVLASLDDVARTFAHLAPALFEGCDLVLDDSDASVHRLAAVLTRARRDTWMRTPGPDGAPLLVHVVVHGTAYVGRCAVVQHGGEWRVRRPLWESLVHLRSAAGQAELAIFHWWLKSLSDAEIDRNSLADRYRAHVEQPSIDPLALEPMVSGDALGRPRTLPRLTKPRYDTLFKHLKAHLPELRDLGEHFPSAERFAELGFRHLEFLWLGGGRMLLIHGPSSSGVHLFWLDARGFRQAAFYPSDAPSPGEGAVPYGVTPDGAVLRVEVQLDGRPHQHEMLWWGP